MYGVHGYDESVVWWWDVLEKRLCCNSWLRGQAGSPGKAGCGWHVVYGVHVDGSAGWVGQTVARIRGLVHLTWREVVCAPSTDYTHATHQGTGGVGLRG